MIRLIYLLTACAMLALGAARAEDWPSRPISVISPYPPGGSSDLFARLAAEHLQRGLNSAVVVENRAGAGGTIGTGQAARAAADGYTLLMGSSTTHAINPFVYKALSYDTKTAFVPICLFATLPNILVVNPKLPVKSVDELIAYAKANEGKLTYGSGGFGTIQQLAAELFKLRTGVQMVHVPYRGSGEIMPALIAGEIDLVFDNMTIAWPHAKAGAVRPLGITSMERNPAAPDLPAIGDTLGGFEAVAWYGLFAPTGTPQSVIERIAALSQAMLARPDVIEKLTAIGATPTAMGPDAFAAFIERERGKWELVVRTAQIKVE